MKEDYFLATHKSAIKRSKQNEKSRTRNTSIKSSIKTKIKSVIQAVETKDKAGSEMALTAAIPAIDKAAAKGVFHKKNASRKISRLTKKVRSLQS
jgi:small subunit ribosomal protein S20